MKLCTKQSRNIKKVDIDNLNKIQKTLCNSSATPHNVHFPIFYKKKIIEKKLQNQQKYLLSQMGPW